MANNTVRRSLAQATLDVIDAGQYLFEEVTYHLASKLETSKKKTSYYGPDSQLSSWNQADGDAESSKDPTQISILEISTLDGARLLAEQIPPPPYDLSEDPEQHRTDVSPHSRIGILNFASAKKPGGGFLGGAQAQEESIARSSTLYPTLMTKTAQQFYSMHNKDPKGGYYSHAMIYSPSVIIFRNDNGSLSKPTEVEVLTSPAVNAGLVRKTLQGKVAGPAEEVKIGKAMKERMGRILYLFEKRGVKNIVLGSFGTGVFQNDVSLVAAIWADLLVAPGARFQSSFDRVVFAILGKKTFDEFKQTFEDRQA